ncbi:MAG: bifunctional metallophosphatase/5'-nucleotidase [Erysipelotrichaceae bacterium]|nr:bifunctional metallophosphatase/5'-nucleotidase [Erysipelotrichaceae bacterium]
MRRLIGVILILMFLLSGCQETESQKDDIYIFYTSDVHCGVEENLTLASLKALVGETKKDHEFVSLVDLGDYLQGGTLGSLSKGKLIIDLMNAMEYDVATFGNHEFDYGLEELSKRMSEADFDLIASNVQYSGSQKNIFDGIPEYIIKDYGGTKVAFLGILTPKSRISSTPKFFMENDAFVYNFYSGNDGEDLYDKVQSLVDQVRKQGADYVIAMTHLGSLAMLAPYDSISLISHTEGIDVVLDSHSHSVVVEDRYPNKNGEDVILSSVGTKLMAAGELILGKDGNISTLHINEYAGQDEEVLKKVDEANAVISEILSQKVCNLAYDMPIVDEEGIRMTRARETTVADFFADAIRFVLDCDVAVLNGGGVRSSIYAGEVLYKDLLNVAPFQNNLALVYASGQQIMDALEFGSRFTERLYKLDGNTVGENGAFLQVSGLKYMIDTSVESSAVLDENDMFAGFANENRRVKDVMILENEEYVPIDPDKVYTVGGFNYVLLNSGDGNTVLKDCEVIIENGLTDVETLRAYLDAIGGFGEKYRTVEGRITIE